jgi:hypothetical protein
MEIFKATLKSSLLALAYFMNVQRLTFCKTQDAFHVTSFNVKSQMGKKESIYLLLVDAVASLI